MDRGKVNLLSWVAIGVLVCVLAQAVLAGQYFSNPDLIKVHGYLANVTFLGSLALAALAFLAKIPGEVGKWLKVLTVVMALACTAQTGLGYAGRENLDLLQLHVPLGVAIFGASVAIAMLAIFANRLVGKLPGA